jgi:hypothetical protein
MSSISYTKTYNFILKVFKKKFLLLQVPILLFISVPFFNTFMTQDSSRQEGHLLIDKMKTGEINMTEFQQELAQISKGCAAKNKFQTPLLVLLCMKVFLYWSAIISTIIIGLAYHNNTSLVIPSRKSLVKSAIVIISYFFSMGFFAFPVGFTIKILNTLMHKTPIYFVAIFISLLSLGLFLFLTSCFSSTLPLVLDTDGEIYSSIRKSYRMSKNQAVYMFAIFITILMIALLSINFIAIILGQFFPTLLRVILYKYASGLVGTISVMILVAFYHQLTTPESFKHKETMSPGIMPPHGA